jgi:hypothetical protein
VCSKIFIVTLGLVAVINTVNAQIGERYIKDSLQIDKWYAKDSTRIKKFETDTVSLHNKRSGRAQALTQLPFSFFICKDVRFDTNSIGGYNSKVFVGTGYHRLKFHNSTSAAVTKFLNDTTGYIFNPHGGKVVCFIKQFRVTQVDSIVGYNKKLYTTLRLSIEAFLESGDHYYPALRLDTIGSSFSVKAKDFSLVEELLNVFKNKASLTDTGKVLNRKAYSYNDMMAIYAQRYKKPILQDTILNRGVYKTISEFFNNNPSIKDFQFHKGLLLVVNEKDELVPTREVFGVCDGERIVLRIHNSFVPLVRQGNTFEFLADMNLLYKTYFRDPHTTGGYYYGSTGEYAAIGAATLVGALIANANYNSSRFVYELDMETGEIY